MDSVAVYYTPEKGQLCQNYRTISPISISSKVMLKVILNRLKPQAEEIIAEKQAGFRAGRSTTELIFKLRVLCKKYLQHQQNLYHVFIDFKKAFDRVWYATLWATMWKYDISANLVRTIEQLYDKATSAVQMNGSIGEWKNNSRSKAEMSSVTHPLQHFSRTDHVCCPGRLVSWLFWV